MEQLKLSPRLQRISDFVPKHAKVIDVGTDHGYIPVYLALQGRCAGIIAADIHEGPLAHARRSAALYGVPHCIEFMQTDGLSGIDAQKADTVIIAGMGGELISAILSQAEWACRDALLILQPQSKIAEMIVWLHRHSVSVFDADLVEDGGKLYLICAARHTDLSQPLREIEQHIPACLVKKRDPLLMAYLDRLILKYERSVKGKRRGKCTDTSVEVRLLEQFRSLKEYLYNVDCL